MAEAAPVEPPHKPVTRRRGGWPKGKPRGKPSTRDQVAQTLAELRPACTANMATAATAALEQPPPPPPANNGGALPSTAEKPAKKSVGEQFVEAFKEMNETVVRRLIREDPRTQELIEAKKDLRDLERKLDENKHFDQRVLEEAQKMKRHVDEALAELAPLKKRLMEPATPSVPDPRLEKLEKQNTALMARLNAIEARLGAMEESK